MPAHFGIKYKILRNAGLIIDDKDYIEAKDKSLIASDWMIDDKPENVQTAFGRGILFRRPHNLQFQWADSVNNWNETMNFFLNNSFGGWRG